MSGSSNRFRFQEIDGSEEKFVRSASQSLITNLTNLQCARRRYCATGKLHEVLTNTDGVLSVAFPSIADCGHHICNACATSDFQCFFCHECGATKPCKKPSLPKDEYLKVIFLKLKGNGVKCDACGKMNPQFNSVADKKSATTYYCVWCASGKTPSDPPVAKKAVKLIKDTDMPVRTNANTVLLDTLDPTTRDIGCIFVECCVCAKVLYNNKPGKPEPTLLRLTCGHYCHKTCSGEPLHCRLCERQIENKLDEAKPATIPKIVQGTANEGTRCELCKNLHPKANLMELTTQTYHRNVCVWCVVSRRLTAG